MKITIDTRSTTTGSAVAVADFYQKIYDVPIGFFEGMQEADRGEIEDFGEGLDG